MTRDNFCNPLPYTIRDIMLTTERCKFIRNRNKSVLADFEAREFEFKEIFGIDLIFFIDSLAGFDYVKFTRVVLGIVPNGVSYTLRRLVDLVRGRLT